MKRFYPIIANLKHSLLIASLSMGVATHAQNIKEDTESAMFETPIDHFFTPKKHTKEDRCKEFSYFLVFFYLLSLSLIHI